MAQFLQICEFSYVLVLWIEQLSCSINIKLLQITVYTVKKSGCTLEKFSPGCVIFNLGEPWYLYS